MKWQRDFDDGLGASVWVSSGGWGTAIADVRDDGMQATAILTRWKNGEMISYGSVTIFEPTAAMRILRAVGWFAAMIREATPEDMRLSSRRAEFESDEIIRTVH